MDRRPQATPGAEDTLPGTVTITFDGTGVGSTAVPDGDGSLTFRVPEDASAGPHTVRAGCDQDDTILDSRTLAVPPPEQQRVVVPDLIGSSLQEAEVQLDAAGLRLGRVSGPAGEPVLSQSIEPFAKVDPDSSVDVELGSPVEPRQVPDLLRLSKSQAERALAARQLRLGRVSGGTGVVVGQDPPAGDRVPPGTKVDVTLGPAAPALVTVPDLLGHRVRGLAGYLRERSLAIGTVDGEGTRVHAQRPRAGARVRPGSAVSVTTTAVLPPPAGVVVPDLRGLPARRAATALSGVGLLLSPVDPDDLARRVTGQSPAAGTRVPSGSTVSVTLAPPSLVVVPDLVGHKVEDLRGLLREGRLRLGTVRGDGPKVRAQLPRAGTRVRPGSAVNVTTVARPPRHLVAVPQLRGHSVDQARDLLGAVGLGLSLPDPHDQGQRVTGQRPAAGTMAPVGSTVAVRLEAAAIGSPGFDLARFLSPLSPLGRLAAAALALVVVAGAGFAARLAHARRVRHWVGDHLELRPRDVVTPAARARPRDDRSPPDLVVAVQGRPDPGTQILEEAHQ